MKLYTNRILLLIGILILALQACQPFVLAGPEKFEASTPAPEMAVTKAATQAAPTTPLPAGWVTHTSRQCEYAISFP